MKQKNKIKKSEILCPRCHAKNTWRQDNTARPFCSERCKLIDLGAWANEEHKIPGTDDDKPTNVKQAE